jgi:hypothetical protein
MVFVMADVIMVGMGKHVVINVLLIVWVINVLWILVNVIWVVSMTNMENTVKILVLTVKRTYTSLRTNLDHTLCYKVLCSERKHYQGNACCKLGTCVDVCTGSECEGLKFTLHNNIIPAQALGISKLALVLTI